MSRSRVLSAMAVFGLLAVLLVPNPAQAQQAAIGVQAGLAVSNVSTDDSDLGDTSSRSGFAAGVFAAFPLSSSIFIQPEAMWSPKGFKVSQGSDSLTGEFNYFELAALIKFLLSPESSVRPALSAGPAFAFESSCNVSAEVQGQSGSTSCDDADLERKKSDFGILFGAGVEMDVASFILMLNARYNLGLKNLETGDDSSGSTKLRTWQFLVGLGFPIG